MINIVRKTLEIYLREKRLPTQGEFTTEDLAYTSQKNALFVTLFLDGKVIASMGRIACLKENSFVECMDLSLQCLKDERFSVELQSLDALSRVQIRVDIFSPQSRRILKDISELNVATEGLIFLSQSLGKLSVVLPKMVKDDPTPEKYLAYAKKKANIEDAIPSSEYVIYGLTTSIVQE